MLYIAEHSSSREKTLEKAIATVTNVDWVNQVPTASGLVHPGDTHCNIDLVERDGTKYSFIELKVDSNTPLFAAIECVLYGIVYAFTRRRMCQLNFDPDKKHILAATHVDLVVLAPRVYYKDWNLRWLDQALSSGLHEYSQQLDYTLDFAFHSFPEGFVWEHDSLAKWGTSDLHAALRNRYALYATEADA